MSKTSHLGFTLIETLIVILLIGILLTGVYFYIPGWRQETSYNRAVADMAAIADAAKLYINDHEEYPDDLSALTGLVAKGSGGFDAIGPWKDSQYYFDNWDDDSDGFGQTQQVRLSFCVTSAPDCQRPTGELSTTLGTTGSLYHCIRGDCRGNEADTVPSYCVNCGQKPDF